MLAEKLGPNGLVALEAILIERVEPTGFGVNVLAFLRVAAVIGLLEGPAVWNGAIDVRDRRKRVQQNVFDVSGIGIEAMSKHAMGSERRLCFSRECRTKLGETREARARLHGRDSDERDFKGQDFVRLYWPGGNGKTRKTPSPEVVALKISPDWTLRSVRRAAGTGRMILEKPASRTTPSSAAVVCACWRGMRSGGPDSRDCFAES